MITFRHFLTSLVAVFLALAVGIVLGGGPLSDVTDPDPTPAAATDDGAADPAGVYAEGFAGAVGPLLTSAKLAERGVAVVTAPGVNEETLTALAEQVAAAGGAITGRYSLTESMVSPEQKSLVDTLGSQLMTQQGKTIAADATTYDRIGQLLGVAIATTTPEGDAPSGKQTAIIDSLARRRPARLRGHRHPPRAPGAAGAGWRARRRGRRRHHRRHRHRAVARRDRCRRGGDPRRRRRGPDRSTAGGARLGRGRHRGRHRHRRPVG